MNQSIGCMQQSHQVKQVEYVCLHKSCQLSRLLCQKCLDENTHKHGESNNQFILDEQQFFQKVNENQVSIPQQVKILEKQQAQLFSILKEAQQLVEVIQLLMDEIQSKIQEYQGILDYNSQIRQIKFEELGNLRLDKLFNIDHNFLKNSQIQQLQTQSDKLQEAINIIKASQWMREELQMVQNESQIKCQNDKKQEFIDQSRQNQNDKERICGLNNHEQSRIEFVCTYPYCQLNRFLCSRCIKDEIHRHMQPNNDHLISFNQLLEAVKQIIKKVKKIYYIHQIKQKDLLVELRSLIQECNKQNDFILQKLIMSDAKIEILQANKFNKIDQDKILQLYYGGQYYLVNNLSVDKEQINKNIDKIKQINDSWNSFYQLEQDKLFEQNNYLQKYEREENIFEDRKRKVNITKNYKFYSLKLYNNFLIFDFEKNIFFDRINNPGISCTRFINDGKLLYIGDDGGFIYKYALNENQFQLSVKQQIHKKGITQILLIQQEENILTASNDRSIVKIDINLQNILIQLNAHDDEIYGLDYNENNIIVSCSVDKSIKLWEDNQLVIQYNHNFGISQVLFLKSDNQLISQDFGQFINIWLVQYNNKILQKVYQIKFDDQYINMSFILNKQYFVFVQGQHYLVYSSEGVLAAKIKRKITIESQFQTWSKLSGFTVMFDKEGVRPLWF